MKNCLNYNEFFYLCITKWLFLIWCILEKIKNTEATIDYANRLKIDNTVTWTSWKEPWFFIFSLVQPFCFDLGNWNLCVCVCVCLLFFLIFIYSFWLWGRLSCGAQDLRFGARDPLLRHADSVAACVWSLVPRPGIEPGPPALGAWSLTHWTTREVPNLGNWVHSSRKEALNLHNQWSKGNRRFQGDYSAVKQMLFPAFFTKLLFKWCKFFNTKKWPC